MIHRDVSDLRKSLATELRQAIPKALAAHKSLRQLVFTSRVPITAMMIENLAQDRAPTIYLANAGRIGAIGADAMGVVIVYSLLETARDSIRRGHAPTPAACCRDCGRVSARTMISTPS
jgi:hypothetical protein